MKTTRLVLLLLISYLFQTVGLKAQQEETFNCGSDEKRMELINKYPDILKKEQELEKFTEEYIKNKKNNKSSNQTYVIPVVFHVLHEYGSENISDAQIFDAIRVLNEDFSKSNADTSLVIPDFDTLIGTPNIEFRLAQIDAFGNCTNGIDRIHTHLTNNADNESKLNIWDRTKYLNIWVVKTIGDTPGTAGYAQFPGSVDNPFGIYIDGIVVLHNYVGAIGTSNSFRSRTLSHEVGHWINLAHPWGFNNDPGVVCGDDGVHDTPETKGSNNCANLYKAECTIYNIVKPYIFSDVTTTSGTTDPTTVTPEVGLDFSSFSAAGVSTNPTDTSRFSFSNWDLGATDQDTTYANLTGSINTSKYYEFTVSPQLGYLMTIQDLTFKIQRSGTGVRTFAVRSDADNFSSNLGGVIINPSPNISIKPGNIFFINNDTTSVIDGCRVSVAGSNFTDTKSTRTFRIYAWNAEDANGTFSLDSISITTTSSVIENIQNYMDYSYCSHMFTIGQVDRMRAALNSSVSGRNNLWSQANLVATGTDVPNPVNNCIPVADFTANQRLICQGDVVTFTDASWRTDINSVNWTFNGGTPSTSSNSTQSVTFNNLYWQEISITATGAAGSNTKTNPYYIHVSPPWSQYSGAFYESFENSTANQSWFSITNQNNASIWQPTSSAAATGSNSMYLNAHSEPVYFPNYIPGIGRNDIDALISPSFDLSSVTSGVLTFKFSAATRATVLADITEEFKVYASLNCGKSWLPLRTIQGIALANAGSHNNPYFPTTSSQWETVTINLQSILQVNNVRFKFEYKSGKMSNNFFLDDINISGIVGVDENDTDDFNLNTYPNPFNESTTVSYRLNKSQNVTMRVYDLLGNVVLDVLNDNQAQGEHTLVINRGSLQSGIYLLKLTGDNGLEVNNKIVIQ
jgi:hypothetical protein